MGEIIAFKREKENKMESIYEVADYLLAKGPMNNKKLQKLCYYVQAWSLTWFNDPLVDAEFEAWVHGPVCVELYHLYKEWGYLEIRKAVDISKLKLSEVHKQVIDAVYNAYGCFTAEQLESFSHSELPWIRARIGYLPTEYCRVIIRKDDMIEEFSKRL